MAVEAVVEFSESTFEADVLQADKPVLVDFWAEWCAPCKMLSPTIDALATEFEGKAVVGKLDTEKNRELTVKYDVMAIPTILVFKNGEIVKKFVGMTSKNDLAEALTENL